MRTRDPVPSERYRCAAPTARWDRHRCHAAGVPRRGSCGGRRRGGGTAEAWARGDDQFRVAAQPESLQVCRTISGLLTVCPLFSRSLCALCSLCSLWLLHSTFVPHGTSTARSTISPTSRAVRAAEPPRGLSL